MPARARFSAITISLALGVALAVLAVAGFPALGARSRSTSPHRAQSAGPKNYSAHASYHQTNAGKSRGGGTVGIQGKGSFSATLKGGAAFEAALIAIATGVPVTKIAKGGTYVEQWDSLSNGNAKGLVVARFKSPGLGALCISYLTKYGRFVPGQSFVPASGSFTAVGGTGTAAKWHGTVTYKQTNVAGSSTEQFSATGSAHVSSGSSKGMTAACKHVAALAHR